LAFSLEHNLLDAAAPALEGNRKGFIILYNVFFKWNHAFRVKIWENLKAHVAIAKQEHSIGLPNP